MFESDFNSAMQINTLNFSVWLFTSLPVFIETPLLLNLILNIAFEHLNRFTRFFFVEIFASLLFYLCSVFHFVNTKFDSHSQTNKRKNLDSNDISNTFFGPFVMTLHKFRICRFVSLFLMHQCYLHS